MARSISAIRDRVVVSRRDVLRSQRRAEERSAFDQLEVGATVTGQVVAMTDYGGASSAWPVRNTCCIAPRCRGAEVATMENHASRAEAQAGRHRAEPLGVHRPVAATAGRRPPSNAGGGGGERRNDQPAGRLRGLRRAAVGPGGLVHLSEMAEGAWVSARGAGRGERVRVMVVGIDRKRRRRTCR